MIHVSRFSEELVLWMSQNFGFIDLADRFCTGSSIMPQKKNPTCRTGARQDRARGRPPDGLLTLMKASRSPTTRTIRKTKEPLFDTVDTLRDTLRIFCELVGGIVVARGAMERAARRGYATATDPADYLVKKGLPFRDAHEAVAHAVKVAIQQGVDLRAAAGHAAGLQRLDRRRRVRGADAARLAGRAQAARRHRAAGAQVRARSS